MRLDKPTARQRAIRLYQIHKARRAASQLEHRRRAPTTPKLIPYSIEDIITHIMTREDHDET